MSSGQQSRVIVWVIPRSTSSAFAKSITARHDVKFYFEPFAAADHFGPEGNPKSFHKGLEEPDYTFTAVKTWLEADVKTDNNVFVKDMAYAVHGRYNMIPVGYKHSFLIRNPEKVYRSLYKIFVSKRHLESETLKDWLPKEPNLYKSLTEIVNHVENNMKSDICIMDSDDIVKNPPKMVEKYCLKMGLCYTPELLSWEPGIPEDWCIASSYRTPGYNAWFQDAFTSTGWRTDATKPSTMHGPLPQDVIRMIDEAIPYYEALRSHPKVISTDS